MGLQRIAAIAVVSAISAVSAFKDTSPFFLFSSANLDNILDTPNPHIVSSSQLSSRLQDSLKSCPAKTYVIAHQPSVTAIDYVRKQSAPHLRRWVVGKEQGVKTSVQIPEVVGGLNSADLVQYLQKTCRAEVSDVDVNSGYISITDKSPRIVNVQMPALSTSRAHRETQLAEHDSILNSVMSTIGNSDFVVIYTTSPLTEKIQQDPVMKEGVYEMDEPFPSALHTELKRDLSARAKNGSSDLPLFEKYEFLSPGIFMGLVVSLPLLAILYVGISALSSLEVTYFAFSKEMGPSAQRKQG